MTQTFLPIHQSVHLPVFPPINEAKRVNDRIEPAHEVVLLYDRWGETHQAKSMYVDVKA